MTIFNRRRFRHLSQSPPNDQRAFLEAAALTTVIEGSSCPDAIRKVTARIQWKVNIEEEIQRIENDLRDAHGNTEKMFSFIERIKARTSSEETRQVILELCETLSVRADPLARNDLDSTFRTRLKQELGQTRNQNDLKIQG